MVSTRPFLIAAVTILLIQAVASQIETLIDLEDDSTYMVDETNALVPLHREKHDVSHLVGHGASHVELIDVTCDAKNGMRVTIEFDNEFNGIIYSQGYFSDPKCRFVQAGGNKKEFNFVVPYDGCGSKKSCSVCASVDNILVIQSDETITESWDTARRITCSQSEVTEKTIYFKPFVVDMLEVVNVPTATGGVECWMDIQVGSYPKINPIPDRIKIGETLSVLVYLKDPLKEYDIFVKDCYAYDHEDYSAKTTGKLQLSDSNGCSRKKKLFGGWTKATDVGNSGATSVIHNTLYAFKFPDKAQVYLKCDIEICRNGCDAPICDGKVIESKKKTTLKIAATTTTVRPTRQRVTTTISPLSRAPTRSEIIRKRPVAENVPETTRATQRTRAPVSRVTATATAFATGQIFTVESTTRTARTRGPALRTKAPVPITDRVPVQRVTETRGRPRGRVTTAAYLPPPVETTVFSCDNPESENDPRCRVETTTKFSCSPDSTDPRCPANCDVNPRDPRCPKPTTARPTTTRATRGTRPTTVRVVEETTRPQRTRAPNTRPPTRARQTTTQATYLPPDTSTERVKIIIEDQVTKAPLCKNGAIDASYPDCCKNYPRGRGQYCCENGANNAQCELSTTTRATTTRATRPATRRVATTTKAVYLPPVTEKTALCENGAVDAAYPNCCKNYPRGRGQYCCENGAENPQCQLQTTTRAPQTTRVTARIVTTTRTPTTTRRIEPTTTKPIYLPPAPKCSNGAVDAAYPNCCKNYPRGKGQYCCENGANNAQCQLPTTTTRAATTGRKYEPTTTKPVYLPPAPKCSNGAVDAAYPDCCKNYPRGRGQYCCENGANNAQCQLPTTTRATTRTTQTTTRAATTTRTTTRAAPTTPRRFEPTTGYLPPDTTRAVPTTTRATTTRFSCTPGSTDPRCPPNCSSNPNDPRCPKPTTRATTRAPATTKFVCAPGSTDPRCPKPFTTAKPTVRYQPLTTTKPSCYPGSPDPNCPQPYRPSSTRPPVTYLPPFPASEPNRRQRQIDPALIEDINGLANPGSPDFHTIESSLDSGEHASYEHNDLHIRKKRSYPAEKEIISITLNFKGYQFA